MFTMLRATFTTGDLGPTKADPSSTADSTSITKRLQILLEHLCERIKKIPVLALRSCGQSGNGDSDPVENNWPPI